MKTRSNLPHVYRSTTGVLRYRRRVPDRIRPVLGQTEVIRSLRTSDPKVAAIRYASVHREVEALFSSLDKGLPSSTDTTFDMAVASLRSKLGIDPDAISTMPREVREDFQDALLAVEGIPDQETLADALEDSPTPRIKAVAAAMSILAGGKQKPTLARCLVPRRSWARQGPYPQSVDLLRG